MDSMFVKYVSEGYHLGYSQPEAEAGIPLDEPWITYYRKGMEAGRMAREEADATFDGPTIGPDPGGEPWDHYEERFRVIFEVLFHQHPPHTEVEMEVPEPPPVNVVR